MRESSHKHQLSMSELRGIILVILGVIALVFYYDWWFQEGRLTSPWLVLGLIAAIFYGLFQILASWLVYLWTHHRPKVSSSSTINPTIDVFVTACGEEVALVEQALGAACGMLGDHQTWLLDDGHDPVLAHLAKQVGAGYLTRQGRKDAKAGNVNAALSQTSGDIVIIFDIDHLPRPDFLQQTIGCFADPMVGFVQVMPTFSNSRQSWVARAAAETSLDFYNPTSKGMDGLNSVTKMGSNALIRRVALNSIGGYQPGLAEDLATSVALHAAGWSSRYVAEPLAPGLAPPDLTAWFMQQFKWARGVFEVLLYAFPWLVPQLTWGQRLSYAVRMTKYLIGPVICIHVLVTIAVLLSGHQAAQAHLRQYIIHLAPIALADMLIRQLALRRWRHPSVLTGSMWRAITLVYATWPIYTAAWVMAMLRLPLNFQPTPKSPTGSLKPLWLLPQMASLFLLAVGIVNLLIISPEFSSTLLLGGFATVLGIPHLGLLSEFLNSYLAPKKVKHSTYELSSPTIIPTKKQV
jgi:cellulose synthase (UDP-forming)